MKNLIKVLALTLVLGVSAKAGPITGTVTFQGNAVLDNSSLAAATAVSSFVDVEVDLFSGTFAAEGLFNEQSVGFNPASWNFSSGAVSNFWFVGGFNFDLISSSITTQSSTFLNVTGLGTLSYADYEDTLGIWSFTIPSDGVGGTFSFSASTTSVPDGGTTALLLGASLLGIGFAARRKR